MSQKVIKIGDYVFILDMTGNNLFLPTSSHFLLDKNYGRYMTEKELKKGQKIQKQIFDGKYDHLIPNGTNAGEEI